jgi:hypothetical protein
MVLIFPLNHLLILESLKMSDPTANFIFTADLDDYDDYDELMIKRCGEQYFPIQEKHMREL